MRNGFEKLIFLDSNSFPRSRRSPSAKEMMTVSTLKSAPRSLAEVFEGHWVESLFLLSVAQLGQIDNLGDDKKSMITESFKKAAYRAYGPKWPNSLRLALTGTAWGKGILPPFAPQDGDFAGLELSAAVDLE